MTSPWRFPAFGSWRPIRPGGLAPLILAVCLPVAMAQGADWTIDRSRSDLAFVGGSGEPPAGYRGRFTRWTADIRFDPADPSSARIRAEIDPTSISLGHDREDSEARGPEFLDAARFPVARFSADGARPIDGGQYAASGTLTVRGVSVPVEITFSLRVDQGGAAAFAQATVSRLAFGVGATRWSDPRALADDIRIEITIAARRQ